MDDLIKATYTDLLIQIGRPALNARYPKEFELYMCALELIDQEGATLRYFIFPVMPSNIDESQPQITNIKKSLAGITVLSNPTFVPGDISLSGNFGRKFKVLLGVDYTDLISSFSTQGGQLTSSSVIEGASDFFDKRVKTGYGCCKILEEIIAESKAVDEKGVRRLIFYNPALGNNYLVKPTSLRFSMSQESNMIWNYSLNLKTIASLESLNSISQTQQSEERLITTGYIQQQAQKILSSLTSILR